MQSIMKSLKCIARYDKMCCRPISGSDALKGRDYCGALCCVRSANLIAFLKNKNDPIKYTSDRVVGKDKILLVELCS
jgi:hypothetical protein